MWVVQYTDSDGAKHTMHLYTRGTAIEQVRFLESQGHEPVCCWYDDDLLV